MADRASRAPAGPPPLPPRASGKAPAEQKLPVDAKLVARAGPSEGQEFELTGREQVIGRSADADISIPDTSVSRRHAKVFKRGPQWMVADLASGNGTLVNGERTDAETPMHHQDVLTLGDTELVFEDTANITDRSPTLARGSGAVPVPSSVGPPKVRVRGSRYRTGVTTPPRSSGRPFAKILVLALAAGGVYGAYKVKVKVDERASLLYKKKSLEQRRLEQVGEVYQQANKLAADEDFKAASERYKEVAEMVKQWGLEKDYEDLQERLDRAQREIPNQVAYAEAKAQLAKGPGHLKAAAEALAKVPADSLLRDVDKTRDLLKAKAQTEVAQAQDALDKSRPQVARELAEDVLAAVPDQRDARAVLEQAEKVMHVKHAPVRQGDPWSEAVSRFIRGDLAGAQVEIALCAEKAPRCAQLQKQMQEFAELQKRVDALDAKGLQRLEALEHEISEGRGSTLGAGGRSRNANLLYQRAVAARQEGRAAEAEQLGLQALTKDPGHSGARALVQEISEQAHQVYIEGYQKTDVGGDLQEAAKDFRKVLSMTASGDEWHQKALKQLQKHNL